MTEILTPIINDPKIKFFSYKRNKYKIIKIIKELQIYHLRYLCFHKDWLL